MYINIENTKETIKCSCCNKVINCSEGYYAYEDGFCTSCFMKKGSHRASCPPDPVTINKGFFDAFVCI